MSEWQPARLIVAHPEKYSMPRELFSSAKSIQETKEIVLIRETSKAGVFPIVCDAEKYFEVMEEPGQELSVVCEHEILTD